VTVMAKFSEQMTTAFRQGFIAGVMGDGRANPYLDTSDCANAWYVGEYLAAVAREHYLDSYEQVQARSGRGNSRVILSDGRAFLIMGANNVCPTGQSVSERDHG